jgi:dipeptidyl aminopeptidase/acylaminoacyl peptidase
LLEDLIVSLAYPEDPQLSPDGRLVAWVATPYGREGDHPEGAIWIAPSDGAEPARRFTYGNGRDEHPRWSPDGQSLAFLSDRAERGVTALYRMATSGGEARLLHKREKSISAFEWSPGGDRVAFLAPDDPADEDKRRVEQRDDADVYGERWEYNRLRILSVESGEATALETGDRHVLEIAWSPDGARIAFLASPTPEIESYGHTELYVARVADGQAQRLCSIASWGAMQVGWSSDGRSLLYVGSHDPLPQSAFTTYAVDVMTGESRVLAPREDDEECGLAIRPVSSTGRAMLCVARGLTSRLERIDLETDERELVYGPDRGDFAPAFSVIAGRDDETVLAIVQSRGNQPPEVHAGTPGSLQRLSDHHEDLASTALGTQEPFYWTAPDGLELDGLLIRPPEAADGPLPTVVLVHGGPYGRWSDSWHLRPTSWGQWLAIHGYAVLMPNCRGGLGHGNEFAKAARGDVGGKDFLDVMSAVDAAIESGIADADRLGIGGWSQGGFMTAWAVTQTNRFKAGVMGAGISDWGMMSMTSDVPTFESVLSGDRPWDGPGPHNADRLSPISYAANVETPLLILHGKEDARVPVSQAIGYERALRERGVPVQLVTYPREPHGIRERAHQRDLLRRVRGWYARWL